MLASKLCGARTIAVEPDPGMMQALHRNVEVNGIEHLVQTHEVSVGAEEGTVHFTLGRDTTNHVVTPENGEAGTRSVRLTTLDALLGDARPTLIKLDVEGHEAQALAGACRTLQSPSLLAIESESGDMQVGRRLAEAGFQRACYGPSERSLTCGTHNLSAGANALFIRSPEASRSRLAKAPRRTILGRAC